MRAKAAIAETSEVARLRADNAELKRALAALRGMPTARVVPRKPAQVGGAALVRVIIPDSHGNHISARARDAFLIDLKSLDPAEIIMLGDHLDCGGTFSSHQRNYTNELTDSYTQDCTAANQFLDAIQAAAPRSRIDYLEGNHEQHIERWAAREFSNYSDAKMLVDRIGPVGSLQLAARGIRYYKRSVFYDRLSIPGAIRRGKCIFVHGISHAKHATYNHLVRVGTNVVHGHTHRAQSAVERTVTSDGFGAWCPGTLAKLQPLYKHTEPTSWTHGYGIQFVQVASGRFVHFNVPIMNGESLLDVIRSRLK